MLKPVFFTRTNVLNPFQAPWLNVNKATWADLGGCDQAELAGWNLGRVDLAGALGLLRCGVELVDESELPCWWGFVEKIELYQGRTGAVCDLDQMSNRVRVRYYSLDSEMLNLRATEVQLFSAWQNDLRSQAIYGIKEELVNYKESTSAQAEALRAVTLAAKAWPAARPALRSSSGPGDLVITLKGWWHSTAWRYYEQSAGVIENYVAGIGAQGLGANTDNIKAAQQFTVGDTGFDVNVVWLNVCKINFPADNLQVEIYSESGGLPDVSLGPVAAVAGADISSVYLWTPFVFSTRPALAANTNYWLVLSRSGALNVGLFYKLPMDLDLLFTGLFRLWNGATWQASSPDADLIFRLSGVLETTKQIELMAAAGCGGQFLAGVQIDQASEIYTGPWRAGTRTAKDEILSEVKAGDSAGGRLLVEVTRERFLKVYPAPLKTAAVLRISKDGFITDERGYPLPAWSPAAGQWAILESPWLGGGSPDQEISDRFYIEKVEYDPASGRIRPK